jgi:hypothetical protein
MKTNNEKRFDAAKAAMQGLTIARPMNVGMACIIEDAVKYADTLLAELARTEPAVKESLTPDADRCSTCDGSGAVDSGGVTPWGQGIDIPCPECESRRNPDADGWVVRIPTDPIPEQHNGVRFGDGDKNSNSGIRWNSWRWLHEGSNKGGHITHYRPA